MRYRKPAIDYIRVFAIFLVLWNHIVSAGTYDTSLYIINEQNWSLLPVLAVNGHSLWRIEVFLYQSLHVQSATVGVCVFLMLSGYLAVLSRKSKSAKAYFVSRCIRIFPGLFACTIISAIILGVFQKEFFSLSQYIGTIFLLYPIMGTTPITHEVWVLPVEMLFSLCITHVVDVKFKHCIALSLGTFTIALLYWLAPGSNILQIMLIFTRFFPLLALGATIQLCETYSLKQASWRILTMVVLTFLALKIGGSLLGDQSTYANWQTLVATLIVWFLGVLTAKVFSRFSIIDKIIQFFNSISYEVYLLQVSLALMSIYYLRNYIQNAYLCILLSVALLIAVSYAIHR